MESEEADAGKNLEMVSMIRLASNDEGHSKKNLQLTIGVMIGAAVPATNEVKVEYDDLVMEAVDVREPAITP